MAWLSNDQRRIYAPAWLVLAMVLTGLCLTLDYSDSLWRWDHLLYDSQMQLISRPVPEDIVIVAIDNASLGEIGRWPWARTVHAELVDRLTEADVRAVFLDILFTEPDARDPEGDQLLAKAIALNQKVFLPVIIEQQTSGGQLTETLPMPELLASAAGIGHVDIDIDRDGMARRVFLKEGLGTPHWLSMGVAIVNFLNPGYADHLPGIRNPSLDNVLKDRVVRDHHILLPYSGPPGHFKRLSYIDVLRGDVDRDSLKGKIILVGVTATGLGDFLPTPVSGHSQPMPGVEINANLIDALRLNITIEAIPLKWRLLLSLLLLLPSLLLLPLVNPRYGVVFITAMILLTLLFSAVLLHGVNLWFPPTSVLIGLILGYPLWSWRRLIHAVKYFEQELIRLESEPRAISFYGEYPQILKGLNFWQNLIPLERWSVLSHSGQLLYSFGDPLAPPQQLPRPYELQSGQGVSWTLVPRDNGYWLIGLAHSTGISKSAELLILEYLRQFSTATIIPKRSAYQRVDYQIQQVQEAIADVSSMRRLFSDTLSQMADGLLVINAGGKVVMANEQAAQLIVNSSEAPLLMNDVISIVDKLEISNQISWNQLFRQVLFKGEIQSLEGRTQQGDELLIQISPLSITQSKLHGMMFILSDITQLKQSEHNRSRALHFLSHDLRSPITSLLSLVQMQRQKSQHYSNEEMADRIEHYAKKALRLAEDFLRLARAENSDKADFQETDLITIAHNATDEVYTEAKEKQIQIIRQIDLDEAWVSADASLIERALINLLENAIRYSPVASQVCLRVEVDGETIRCVIEDQGRGISSENLQKVFEPFQRITESNTEQERGTGLGLSFVKVVAEKHNGQVTVTSREGQGSCFSLEIPLPKSGLSES